MKTEIFEGWDGIDGGELSEKAVDGALRRVFRRSARGRVLRVAAAVAAGLLMAFPLSLLMREERTVPVSVPMIAVSASAGEVKEVVLPDESRVMLNSESFLSYPEAFGERREVFLAGEASFDVTSSPEHPFLVRTPSILVSAHGTKFNVRSYFDENESVATLGRGALAVCPSGNASVPAELGPGESYVYCPSSGKAEVVHADVADAFCWEYGNLSFRGRPLSYVIRELERRFPVRVFLATDRYDRARLTASFVHGESPEEIVSAICRIVPGLNYEIKGGDIYLK